MQAPQKIQGKPTKKSGGGTKPKAPTARVAQKTLKKFQEQYVAMQEYMDSARDGDNVNVATIKKLGAFLNAYANLGLGETTTESRTEQRELMRKVHDDVKKNEAMPEWQGEKIITQKRYGEIPFVKRAMSYLMKVYDKLEDAEPGEDGKIDTSAYILPTESAEKSTETPTDQPAPAPEKPTPEQTQTQTAEQTAATMAGKGAGALPPQQQAPADGVPPGSTSNDAGEDDVATATATATPASAPAGEVEATASDSATATTVKTADGKSESIGAAGDGASMGQADIQQAQFAASIQDDSAGVGGRGTKRGGGDPQDDRAQAYQNVEGGDEVDITKLKGLIQEKLVRDLVTINIQGTELVRKYRESSALAGIKSAAEKQKITDEFNANVRIIINRAEEDTKRRAAEAEAANVPFNIDDLFDDIEQRVGEEFNQLVQQAGVSIPNAAERAAFIASMEREEREDVREEARQAQVPEEARRQQRAARVQRAAELREAQNAPPEIPAPVDVSIDIASLNLGDAGTVPSTQMLGDAMMQDKAKEAQERKHRDSLSVQQLKQEIEALHSVYDTLIPEFKRPEHQRQKQAAMASGRPEALRQHLENMMASVRRYYTQGGMRVGVIISRDAFMGMQGGQASGMSVPATSQRSSVEVTKHGQSKFRPQVKNEQVMRGGINTKKTLDNYIPKQDPQTRRPQRPHAQLTRFDHPHPSVELPRRTRPYDGVVLKTKSK
jgi:hypothetical protein